MADSPTRRRRPLARRSQTPAPEMVEAIREEVQVEVVSTLAKALGIGSAGKITDLSGLTQYYQQGGKSPANAFAPLPRATTGNEQMGPGRPLVPIPLDPLEPDGRTQPRQYEYPVAWNIPGGEDHADWSRLRQAANHPIIRKCIDLRISQVVGMDWSHTISPTAIKSAASAGGVAQSKARADLLEEFQDEIERANDWWENPCPRQLGKFPGFISRLLEDSFTFDAAPIYPERTFGGDLLGLNTIDGSTIKPLIDGRGLIPQAPNAAYQQLLYGFPRGEFSATPANLLDSDHGEGEYSNDQLIYAVRFPRNHSPYGLSPVEKVLTDAELYLTRLDWLRQEYTSGAVPAAILKVVAASAAEDWDQNQRAIYQNALNDDLSGLNDARHQWKLLFPGLEPVFPEHATEKYSTEIDQYLITLVCVGLGIMPEEIGFTPRQGLGGKGHNEGVVDTLYRNFVKPLLRWIESLINDVNHTLLGIPKAVVFSFAEGEEEDQLSETTRLTTQVQSAQLTINEARAERGAAPSELPEADELWVFTTNGPVFLKGMLDSQLNPPEPPPALAPAPPPLALPAGEPDPNAPAESTPPVPVEKSFGTPAVDHEELRAFGRFVTKRSGRTWRDFDFDTTDADTATRLNYAASTGDAELTKSMVGELLKASDPKV
jgi:hypothetical protein